MPNVIDRSRAEALIREQVVSTIFQDAPKQSVVMQLGRKLPNMTSKQTRIPVLSMLPLAYWVNGDTGYKQTSRQAWENVYLTAGELAVIVPIPEAVLADAEFDILGEVTPRVNEAIGLRVDQAILFGINRPAEWQNDIITVARQAGNNVSGGISYDSLLGENGLFAKVEDAGYADGLFVSTANDNATVTNNLTIMHPMVQMGNAPTAWTASTGDYLTTSETKTEIKQTVSEIKLTASTSGTRSTIKLTAGGTEITSAQINLSGVVTFSDLSTWNQDKTIINGGNITTGQLHNLNYTTVYDLDNAWIRMGTEAGERVYIDNRHIAWYATINTGSIGLTGVLYSEAGRSYFGASSKYMSYGWVNGLNPTSYVGMQITYNRSDDSDADFNTTRVGVSGKLNVHNLDVWGSKSRVVNTSFGAVKMAAFETPTPTFADWGKGQCGPEGWCLIALDPRYAETIAQYGQPAWLLTDCDGTGHLWAQDCGQYAIVHGAPGQKFSWLAMAAQRGYEGSYADRSDSSYPAGDPAGVELAASTAARAQEASTDAAADLLAIDTGANETADILLEELQ